MQLKTNTGLIFILIYLVYLVYLRLFLCIHEIKNAHAE